MPVYFFVKYSKRKILSPKKALESKNLNAFLLRTAKINVENKKITKIIINK